MLLAENSMIEGQEFSVFSTMAVEYLCELWNGFQRFNAQSTFYCRARLGIGFDPGE